LGAEISAAISYEDGTFTYELIYDSREYKRGKRYEILNGNQIIDHLQQHSSPINNLICSLLNEDPSKRTSAYETAVKAQQAKAWVQEEMQSGHDVMAELTCPNRWRRRQKS